MKNTHSIVTSNGNFYLIDVQNKIVQLLHPRLAEVISGKKRNLSGKRKDYYQKKQEYWKAHGVFQDQDTHYSLKQIDGEFVRRNFISTPQIVFEVTDRCNLKCKYCAYGELYANYDKRNTRNADMHVAKNFLDYYFQACAESQFVNEKLSFGFYGGEPLLNFNFVKETVAYIEERYGREKPYAYYMTTNGLYIDRYADFLVDKHFHLLISLDGDEKASSYRMDYGGNPAFEKVMANILFLREKFPAYFASCVDFSAVLHNRNTIDEVIDFFKKRFGKIPNVGSLNPSGVNPEKKELFARMRNTDFEISQDSGCEGEISLSVITPSVLKHMRFIHQNLFSFYKNYLNLLTDHFTSEILPTATCYPFGKKIYITVNGKILVCERIGHELSLGEAGTDFVRLDFSAIAKRYNEMYQMMYDKQCASCYLLHTCFSCLFHVRLSGCSSCKGERGFKEQIKEEMEYFEANRGVYKYIKESVFK